MLKWDRDERCLWSSINVRSMMQKSGEDTGHGTKVGLRKQTTELEHVELLQLDKSNIRVAEYLTGLPPQKLLREKLHKAVEIAQQRLSQR